jgi:hypothetical protein
VRSQAANLVPNAIIHAQQDRVDVDARFLGSVGQLLRVGWYFVLVVAACSLTVGMVAGVVERRRAPPGRHPRDGRGDAGHRGRRRRARAGVVVRLGPVRRHGVGGTGHRRARRADPLDDDPPLLDVATRHDAVRYE